MKNQTILGRISILTSFSSLNRVRFLSNKLNLGIWGSRKVHAMLHYGLKMVASLYYSTLPVSPENYPNYFVSESDVVIFPRLANSKTWHK